MSAGSFDVTGTISFSAADLEAAAQAEAAAEDTATPATATAVEASETHATVRVISRGKGDDETCSVEVGSSIADLMVSMGWEYRQHSFKLTKDGETGLTNTRDSGTKFGSGSYTLVIVAKVTGGRK